MSNRTDGRGEVIARAEPFTASKKYRQGVEDAQDGFPPNRFLRSDPEYMAGYNAAPAAPSAEEPSRAQGEGEEK
jgi:hypothetical protein